MSMCTVHRMDIAIRLRSLPLQRAIAEFEKQRNKGRVSFDAQSVIKSAWEGGVADLFLSQKAEFIGRWNEQTYQVESGSPGEDLLNAAALQTVLHGGQAFGLDLIGPLEGDSPFDRVLQLAHVSAPHIVFEHVHCVRRD